MSDLDQALRTQLGHTLESTPWTTIGGKRLERYDGKVRDCFIDRDNGERIIVVTDRLSAFDAVVGTIPSKGQVLNQLATFWFENTQHIAPNHMLRVPDPNVMIARECDPLPVELVMRSYLTGVTSTSIWKAYENGALTFCGHPLPEGMAIVQIGLVDWDLAKNYSAEIALKADVRETLRVLVPALKSAGGAALETRAKQGIAALASKNWTAKRKVLVEQISKSSDRSPIDPDWLALQVVETMPANAILVDEGLTSSRQMLALRPHRDRYGYHALASGGIGWGLPASVGVSLANPDRPVVCFSGDGSAMYSIQALWTAAHHKLPLTVVIVNNGGYRIIKQRLLAFHGDDHYVGMDFADPKVDFTALAKSLGLEAMQITESKDVAAALKSAFSRPGAKLIEVVVDGTV